MASTDGTREPEDEFNRALNANAQPRGYVSPEPTSRYNLVVIGAGPAGLVLAAAAAALGGKVALIERQWMGGDCLNAGCVPSKALLASARAAANLRGVQAFGISAGGESVGPTVAIDGESRPPTETPPTPPFKRGGGGQRTSPPLEMGGLGGSEGRGPSTPAEFLSLDNDFTRVMERVRRLRAELSRADSVERFTKLGVDVFFGEGRFVAPDAVEVGGKTLHFARAAITVGSVPAVPDIPGLREAGFETNLSIFNLTQRPESLCIIGGGPIGCELAQAFSRLGTQVTLLQRGPRLLPRDDSDASKLIQARLEDEGVRVHVGAKISAVTRERQIRFEAGGVQNALRCEKILIAAGRRVDVDALNLGAAGVKSDAHGIVVDDYLRTSSSKIYAAGDCCSRFKFTHAADAMARIVVRNALFFGRQRVSKLIIPWTTYTDPEVAQVGLTREEAERCGIAVDVVTVELTNVDRAVLDGTTHGFGRLILKKGTDEILGATLVAPHAGDMIPTVLLTMKNKLGAASLADAIFPYPTVGEIWRKLGDAYNRTRLTPGTKKLLGSVLNWRRGS